VPTAAEPCSQRLQSITFLLCEAQDRRGDLRQQSL
jgi:hypothetical protein